MKATGIVRRIDDLGRVVIPKEIRRTMKIRDGEPLEIFTEAGGSVIFRKYSPAGEQSAMAVDLCEAISRTSGRPTVICDRDSVIAAAGPGHRELDGKLITPELDAAMQTRQIQQRKGGVAVTAAVPDARAAMVTPIIAGGDLCGCVALLDSDAPVSEADGRLAQTAALFFARQMED